MDSSIPPRPFRFGLRTLFVLVTVAAVVACYLAWRYRDTFFHDFYFQLN